MAVPVLKEQLATLVGVPAGSQRLICRGKVLKDDHLLSAYSILLFPPTSSLYGSESGHLTVLVRVL